CHGCGQSCDGYYCESCTCPQYGMTLFNEIYDNCIYGAGKPIICTACGGIEPSYNQNYDDNYYPHESPSFPCYDYCGESHETSQCQPMDQNIDFSEYDQSTSTDRPIFLNDNEDHPVQNKESPENSSEETVVSNPNHQEPPQDSDIHQLIEECSIKVCEEQKQNMENTVLKLVDICHQKQLLCMHDNVEDIIESALDTKLLLINSKSQHPNEKDLEVKNVEEQPAERRNHAEKSLQNFRIIHKSSISLNTSQISLIHAVAPILSTKELGHSLSMGYEHLSITPETKSDEVAKTSAKNLLPIPSECEYVDASLPDPEIASEEEENVVQQEEEEVNFEDISQIQDIVLREKLLSITRLISNIESLNDNSTPDHVFNSFESDNSLLDNFSPEFKTFCDHSEETRSGNTTHANYSFPKYDSFCFEIDPDQERLINLMKNDIPDNLSNDSLLKEVDLFLFDNSIPPGIENVADDPEGDIRFLEELLIDDSILSHESSDFNFEENPSIPRPPPEPPDVETDAGEEIPVMVNDKDEDVDYSYSMFVIFDKMFSLLSAKSEDTIFYPGMDCAQFIKNQPKTRQYQQKNENQKTKPDQEAILSE
nr:hypothetical protein [Tanacetum cinerariifolium]